jgi:hypothetical protein
VKRFIFLASLLILTRFADAQTTNLHTSDLKNEANPLASFLGLGWTGLIIIQVIGLIFLIYSLWVHSFRQVEIPSFDRNISTTKFISLFHFQDTKSFEKIFYKLPTNRNSLLSAIGFIMTFSLITISILVSISTTFLILSEKYRTFYSEYRIPLILYSFCFFIILFWSKHFYKNEMIKRLTIK